MRLVRAIALVALAALAALASCGTPKESAQPSSGPATSTNASATGSSSSSSSSAATTAAPVAMPAGADVFAKLRSDLTSCYEDGKKAVPTMTSGKITFHAAIDASGKTTCVVPSDDNGLTQDVENCMRARLDREVYPRSEAPWSLAIPIVVKDTKLGPGEVREQPPAIETIESRGLTEEVYEVVEGLLPELYACIQGIPKSSTLRVLYVGAKVGSGGQVECALASGPNSIPAETRSCTAKVLARAKFRPPKKGYGLVSVPLNVMSRK